MKPLSRMVSWLQVREQRMFHFINRRLQHAALDRLLGSITHLGGAAATILSAMSLWLFGTSAWRSVGLECIASLVIGFIPVAVIKRLYPRLRPYLVIPGTNTGKRLLTDHSFPSGHTTAVFSLVIPIVLYAPPLGTLLLPIAFLVGLSRIYLGLHYPSDVVAGAFLGTVAGIVGVALVG
jgi:undecaprenyl-diphosphatase